MNNEKLINNKVRLLRLIDIAPEKQIAGRIKLQKIVFLVQQYAKARNKKTFTYEFDYYTYGPFDKNVGIDATYLAKETSFIIENEPVGNEYPWTYSSELEDSTREKLPDYESLFGIEEEELKEIVEKLAKKDYQTLELTATIVFVVNKNICENSKEIVKKKMNVLKPHLMEKYDGAWALAESYFKKN
ncbi:MAG TPA: hypothetical protein PL190_02955 [Caldisericia bacterium]|jgi:uncharacterized protein YwgA|nr:MAG: hypothetical protein BWX90_01309 [bacterium ADurb.Bin132]HNY61111.1 hypothetical protein [Caldisericia bacterium]HOC79083.1 hypothetical protein [Caldisericia bacterium]HOG70121.1 hypothetical protein [Caldisericia bacterium]HPA65477.1 hypothetical protein [Caldisericia bacterium]